MRSVKEANKFKKKKTTQKTEPLTRPRRVGFFPLIVVFVEDMYNSYIGHGTVLTGGTAGVKPFGAAYPWHARQGTQDLVSV